MRSRDREALRRVAREIRKVRESIADWNDPTKRVRIAGLYFTRTQLDAVLALIEASVPAERLAKPAGST